MYIPPLVDPELGLEDNQLLLENKMALSAASDFWNASYINAVGDTLPDTYRQRYVVNLRTGQKSILPVGTTKIPPGYEQREMNILELGCGKGRILYDMIEYTGGTGAGINIDESQLINGMKFALERGLWPRKLNVMYGSYNDGLPFGDGSVDFVYEIGAFTYVIDKSAVFREIFRVLRPGGAFCYNDWTASESFDPADGDQADKIMRIKKFSGLIELHRPSELAAVAERAGFEVLWNGHGGHNAVPSSGLLSQMNLSFGFADAFVTFLIKYKLLPKRLVKGWELLRGGGGVSILRESMDSKWLDIGHVFLIRKPFE
jgi:SAM-dependent methyltransferase